MSHKYYKFEVGTETYYCILPWAGNIPYGHTPITAQEYEDAKNRHLSQDSARWNRYYEENEAQKEIKYFIKDGIPFTREH